MTLKIRCEVCLEHLKDEDIVIMDIANGLKHFYCTDHVLPMKDKGTYGHIINKYSFFSSVR